MQNNKLILDLDGWNLNQCREFIPQLTGRVHAFKLISLFYRWGPNVIRIFKSLGAHIFLDAKLHDIPNSVCRIVEEMEGIGVDILTIHASGEVEMMEAAMRGTSSMEIYAATVLTSIKSNSREGLYRRSIKNTVHYLASLAKVAGVHGLVCSSLEVRELKKDFDSMKILVPAVRSEGEDKHDQWRIDTPANALKNGASYIVIGRQVTEAKDPLAAFEKIEAEIADTGKSAT